MAANEPRGSPEERLESLLAEFGVLLRASVLRVCGRESGVQAEEVVQEARIRLWRVLERESHITHPASYVVRIATTAAIDAMRRVHARREEPLRVGASEDSGDVGSPPALRAPGPSPEELAAGDEVARKVERALATLAMDRARAVRLHLQGFTSAEIGRLLAWTEPRARNLVHRGLKDLRAALAREGIECEADA
jgi:RNA polymerase sigma-70 factor (ECF subfamily)